MTLLDAYALIAFLVGGPASAAVRAILRDGGSAVTTANIAEALDVSARVRGLPVERSIEVLEPLFDGVLALIPLDLPTARRAAGIRVEHYHRSSRPISLADAILLATVRPGDRLATADPDVLAVAGGVGIDTVVLPGESTR